MIATIILICLASGGFFVDLVNHGKDKEPRKHNAGIRFIVLLIQLTLFYYAGLFDKF